MSWRPQESVSFILFDVVELILLSLVVGVVAKEVIAQLMYIASIVAAFSVFLIMVVIGIFTFNINPNLNFLISAIAGLVSDFTKYSPEKLTMHIQITFTYTRGMAKVFDAVFAASYLHFADDENHLREINPTAHSILRNVLTARNRELVDPQQAKVTIFQE
jgi:hypothetical protein